MIRYAQSYAKNKKNGDLRDDNELSRVLQKIRRATPGRIKDTLNPAKLAGCLDVFPKKGSIMRTVESEVFDGFLDKTSLGRTANPDNARIDESVETVAETPTGLFVRMVDEP